MNVREFRDEIEATLAAALGSYLLPNGASTPAIAVRAEGEGLAPGTTVSGVEAVILREPTPVPVRQYRQEQALHDWTLFLVDWNGANTLQQVANQVVYAYPGATVTPVTVPRGIGPRSQMRIQIRDYEAVRVQLTPPPAPGGVNLTTISGLNLITISGIPLVAL